jgi:hypothetical protein
VAVSEQRSVIGKRKIGRNGEEGDGVCTFGHGNGLACPAFRGRTNPCGEIEPRTDGNAPIGVNCLILTYAYSEAGLSTAGDR